MFLYETKINCAKDGIHQITDWIKDCVKESGVKTGIAIVSAPHTTSAISITPYMLTDYDHQDIQKEMDKIVPTRIDFTHQFDTPADASGHIKSAIMDSNITLIVEDGKPVLGHSQGVFFFEFDGPRVQKCQIAVYSD